MIINKTSVTTENFIEIFCIFYLLSNLVWILKKYLVNLFTFPSGWITQLYEPTMLVLLLELDLNQNTSLSGHSISDVANITNRESSKTIFFREPLHHTRTYSLEKAAP